MISIALLVQGVAVHLAVGTSTTTATLLYYACVFGASSLNSTLEPTRRLFVVVVERPHTGTRYHHRRAGCVVLCRFAVVADDEKLMVSACRREYFVKVRLLGLID